MTVLAISDARTNAELVEQCARLGYLADDDLTLDTTFGLGRFWTAWQPHRLIAADLDPTRGRDITCDFTALPFRDDTAERRQLADPRPPEDRLPATSPPTPLRGPCREGHVVGRTRLGPPLIGDIE